MNQIMEHILLQFLQNIVENPNESKQKLQIMCRNCNEIKKKNAESVSEKN